MQPTAPSAIFLMGPTASGKTELAVELLEHLPCEIISVDSAMIYRGMDIGTAKPEADVLARAPHRLIDILDPAERYSAADFRRDALREMQQICEAGRIPLLVGGTMLYFKLLVEGVAPLPTADNAIRERIQQRADEQGLQKLHQQLQQIDPIAAQKIHPNNPQRLLRALEVYEATGVPLGQHWQEQVEVDFPYRVQAFGLLPQDRALLHSRIEARFLAMLEAGFIEEVRGLYRRGDLHLDMPSMRCVGYRQVWQFLQGDWTQQEMLGKGIVATRQLAKRQLTWLRKWPDLNVLPAGQDNLCELILKKLSISTI